MESTQSVVAEFAGLLTREGLHTALAFLNRRTRHRYTALYRFEPPMLRSVSLYDRENPALHVGGDKLMCETYCSIVAEREEAFSTEDSLGDERLEGHPGRNSIQAYYGSPVMNRTGVCVGSLCHFDGRPRLVPESEIPVLERVAGLLAEVCAPGMPEDARGTQNA